MVLSPALTLTPSVLSPLPGAARSTCAGMAASAESAQLAELPASSFQTPPRGIQVCWE